MDKGLIVFAPRVKEGEEQPLPIQVSVSFRLDEKPMRIGRSALRNGSAKTR